MDMEQFLFFVCVTRRYKSTRRHNRRLRRVRKDVREKFYINGILDEGNKPMEDEEEAEK